jgi:hypothetical protein
MLKIILIFVLANIVISLFALYYMQSPYQNCMRTFRQDERYLIRPIIFEELCEGRTNW